MAKSKSDPNRIPSWLTVLPPAAGGDAPKPPASPAGDLSAAEKSHPPSETTTSEAPVPAEQNLASE
jgi:hypothetical protein